MLFSLQTVNQLDKKRPGQTTHRMYVAFVSLPELKKATKCSQVICVDPHRLYEFSCITWLESIVGAYSFLSYCVCARSLYLYQYAIIIRFLSIVTPHHTIQFGFVAPGATLCHRYRWVYFGILNHYVQRFQYFERPTQKKP